ncbi:BnaC06g30750D [Brassica napus]|uniref:BnaC06g30750D protein n=1 Tax=Brassica napus TaxID=3708 RepID=A0A078HSV4_BRANA|nr:BnaC06g30750D [Brassica napus]
MYMSRACLLQISLLRRLPRPPCGRAVVGAPCSRVSPFLLVYLCVVSAEEDGAVSSYRSLHLAWSFSPVRVFSQISSSSLKIGGAWVVGGPLQVFSHLSGWRVTDGWAPSSPHGGSGGSALRYSCSLAVVIGSLDLFRMAIGSRVTNSPVCATLEVVYLSCPIVLYGFLVKWVYTVPVDGLEGGNLRERLLNDGIAGLCHYLVPLVVVSCNQGLRAPFSRARGNRRLFSFAPVLWSELASLFSGTLDAPALLFRALGLVCKLVFSFNYCTSATSSSL